MNIAIVDDHQIVIDGLKLLLKDNALFTIIAETTNPLAMVELLKTENIDLLLTDMMMPNMDGIELAMLARQIKPALKIVALSMNGDGAGVFNMIEKASINGYLLKTIGKAELEKALLIVADGENYFSEEILLELNKYEKLRREYEQINLTTREIEVIKCIAEDMSNKQIASALFISERTVETHRKNILRKTSTHSVVGLLEFVKKHKLI